MGCSPSRERVGWVTAKPGLFASCVSRGRRPAPN
jgi:hypothetical protein